MSRRFLALCRRVGATGVVYDCGSRDGLDGIALMDGLAADALHIFECNPPSAEECRRNAARARRPDAIVVNEIAVSDHDGSLGFFAIDTENTVTPHADGNPGASSLLRANPAYPNERYVQREITVPSTRLDTYIGRSGSVPDVLWMDLQGAELRALHGLGERLREVKVVYCEIGFRPMYVGQPLFHEIDSFLSTHFTLAYLRTGRWPRLPRLYTRLRFGPWLGDAVYVRRDLAARA